MTLTEIAERVESIRAVAHDDERAHGMEDRLRHEVLEYIAAAAPEPFAACARGALSTDAVDFARWCA